MSNARHVHAVGRAVGLAVTMMFGSFLNAAAQQAATTSFSPVVPRLVSFSGKAVDEHAKPITGTVGITFAIYRDQFEGPALWLESQNVTADAKGSYSVRLGATRPEGLPIELFSSGEARWLGITVNGGTEQPRVLLLSVPYALKAADAETLGGLPPSAFMLAAPNVASPVPATPASDSATSTPYSGPSPQATLTGTGTANYVPLWTSASALGSSVLFQSGTGATAKLGLNTITPTSTLDVKGPATIRGNLNLPAIASATASAGASSQPVIMAASSYSSTTVGPINQTFNWQAEAAGNNTASPSATMNLLFASGTAKPAETGLHIAKNGLVTFAVGQTFPGTGSLSSVAVTAPASDFKVTGSPLTKNGTLALAWNVAPTSATTANAIVKRDPNGAFSAGVITSTGLQSAITSTGTSISGLNYGSGSAVFGGSTSGVGVWGQNYGTGPSMDGVHGETSSNSSSGVIGVNNNGGTGVYGSGGTAVTGKGTSTGVYGVGGNTGVSGSGAVGVYGTGSSYGFQTDSNVSQARGAGGWVKGMVAVQGTFAPYKIKRCFNSTLTGSAASTPPCGFTLTEVAYANFWVDFGFEVDDRFIAATLEVTVTTDVVQLNAFPATATAVQVYTWNGSGTSPFDFELIVF